MKSECNLSLTVRRFFSFQLMHLEQTAEWSSSIAAKASRNDEMLDDRMH